MPQSTASLPLLLLLFLFFAFSFTACKQNNTPRAFAPSAASQERAAPPAATAKTASPEKNTPQARHTVLFLGDSLTAGYQLSPEDAFPALLDLAWQRAGRPWRSKNAGVSGDTTSGALSRLNWVLTPDIHTVFLAIGANDGLRGFPIEHTRANLERLIQRIQEHGAKLILAGIQIPTNYGEAYTKAFRELYPALAAKHKIPFLPFLLQDVATLPALNLPDGIHPNAKGHRIIANNLYSFFKKEKLLQ